jgi:ribosomal protein S18 acetylase RimI-like enzyme
MSLLDEARGHPCSWLASRFLFSESCYTCGILRCGILQCSISRRELTLTFAIRPYHPSDLVALYRVCLLTGDSGQDASELYRDPELLGHLYLAPYAVFEPDLCLVLTHDGTPCGYILGTRDSAAFGARCERDWFPVLRERYPLPALEDNSPDADMIRHVHAGHREHPDLAAYPAHLHIDLLPIAQGQGWGRQLVRTFTDRLRALQVPAVYLGVGARNTRAICFYSRVGFHQIKAHDGWMAYGMHLQSPQPGASS